MGGERKLDGRDAVMAIIKHINSADCLSMAGDDSVY